MVMPLLPVSVLLAIDFGVFFTRDKVHVPVYLVVLGHITCLDQWGASKACGMFV